MTCLKQRFLWILPDYARFIQNMKNMPKNRPQNFLPKASKFCQIFKIWQKLCQIGNAAFTVSEFDRVDGLGFAFDAFCVTLLILASQSLLHLNCWHCQELLYYFFDWRWIKINPKRLGIKMYSFLKAFLVLMKLLSLSQFYAPKNIQQFKSAI